MSHCCADIQSADECLFLAFSFQEITGSTKNFWNHIMQKLHWSTSEVLISIQKCWYQKKSIIYISITVLPSNVTSYVLLSFRVIQHFSNVSVFVKLFFLKKENWIIIKYHLKRGSTLFSIKTRKEPSAYSVTLR